MSGLLLTLLSVVLTVIGLAAKQTLSYKNRRLEFQRSVSELLFFHNLDCHSYYELTSKLNVIPATPAR